MFELLLCSILTILPDYLFRRYVQGRRFGHEITFFSVWFELRWGIVACLTLTILLITTVFYFHPATGAAVSYFRTVPVLPEGSGRVAEVLVPTGYRAQVAAGDPLFRLDDRAQRAAVETARSRIEEIDASLIGARGELAAARGRLEEARSGLRQALDELETRVELRARNPDAISPREVERAQNAADARQGGVDAAQASIESVIAQIEVEIPAKRRSAESALAEAEVALDKTVVRAGVTGRLEQFVLREGDIVNPFMRPAGILIPEGAGQRALLAGFGQIQSAVLHPGMIAEATCPSRPLVIIPMVVTEVQSVVPSGQIRPTDMLVDPTAQPLPGGVTVYLEPLWPGGLDGVPPGSRCIANAYTSNHDRLGDPALGTFDRLVLHGIDAIGMVHAMLLRIQALVLPVRTLVLSGGH